MFDWSLPFVLQLSIILYILLFFIAESCFLYVFVVFFFFFCDMVLQT